MSQCFLYDRCNHKDCDKDFCPREYKLSVLYKQALLSERQCKKIALVVDADNTDLEAFKYLKEVENNIVDFVDDSARNNLYIHSTICGNGKSSWAIRLVQTYLSKIWYNSELVPRALFISVPRFLEALKSSINGYNEYADHIVKSVAEADLVVWDDIAAKTGTDYEINKLLSFIETRLCTGKANIFTSNLGTNEMYDALGSRLASRICHGSIDVELHGADKRTLMFN